MRKLISPLTVTHKTCRNYFPFTEGIMPFIVYIDNLIEVDIHSLGLLSINLSPSADFTLPIKPLLFSTHLMMAQLEPKHVVLI
jgi:hypothetical protein